MKAPYNQKYWSIAEAQYIYTKNREKKNMNRYHSLIMSIDQLTIDHVIPSREQIMHSFITKLFLRKGFDFQSILDLWRMSKSHLSSSSCLYPASPFISSLLILIADAELEVRPSHLTSLLSALSCMEEIWYLLKIKLGHGDTKHEIIGVSDHRMIQIKDFGNWIWVWKDQHRL